MFSPRCDLSFQSIDLEWHVDMADMRACHLMMISDDMMMRGAMMTRDDMTRWNDMMNCDDARWHATKYVDMMTCDDMMTRGHMMA